MNKRTLKKIPVLYYDPNTIDWNQCKEKSRNEYLIKVQAVYHEKQALLILNLYHTKEIFSAYEGKPVSPSYRIFLSRKEKEFATQDFTETKQGWTDMTLCGIQYDGYPKYSYKSVLPDNEKDIALIRHYFNFQYDPQWMKYISAFQSEVMKRRKQNKYQDTMRKTQKQMALVPKVLPKDFGKWMQEEALYHSRYIYYEYDRKKKGKGQKGYCTHCKTDVLVDGAKHRAEGICPSCGSRITYLCKSKANWITDSAGVSLIQSCRVGFVLRVFYTEKKYKRTYRMPTFRFYEKERIFFQGDNITKYVYQHCNEINETIWQEADIRYGVQNHKGALYPKNIREVLEKTPYQYSGLFEYAELTHPMKAGDYLAAYGKTPRLEHLAKMGLSYLIDDLIESRSTKMIYPEKPTIFGVLKLSKEDTRFLQKINGGAEILKELRLIRTKQIKITYEQIEEAEIMFEGCRNRFLCALTYTTAGKLLKYIKSQAVGRRTDRYRLVLLDWLDYLEDGKKLKYDFANSYVLFPANLKESHRTTIALLNLEKEKKIKRKRESIKRMYQAMLETYSYSNKYFFITPPKDAEEIVKEGQQLHHCVGNYIDRVARGETTILFVRKKDSPEESFYTMEVHNGQLIQCRGKYNQNMTSEVNAFVEAFKKKILEKPREAAGKSQNKDRRPA